MEMALEVSDQLYHAFGLSICSEIELPELQKAQEGACTQVFIRKEDLAAQWAKHADPSMYYYVEKNVCMFEVPGIAIYKVENGSVISVSRNENALEEQTRLYILGTCMGILLMQRRTLPLHGSALAINGKAYAIVGHSGAGKSTLATALLRGGSTLLSDDVIPVRFSGSNMPMVSPSYPQQKLWQESLHQFGEATEGLMPIVKRERKFAVPVKSSFADQAMPLAGVFELVKGDQDTIVLSTINGLERFQVLMEHTYRNFIVSRMGLMEWHFEATASIAGQTNIYRMERPSSRFTANELADAIMSEAR